MNYNIGIFGSAAGTLNKEAVERAKELKQLLKKIHKESNALVFFSKNPKKLVELVIAELEKRSKHELSK